MPKLISPELASFARKFMDKPTGAHQPVSVLDLGSMLSILFYRDEHFQVEQYVVRPSPAMNGYHRHPNADTIDIVLCGKGEFVVGERQDKFDGKMAIYIDHEEWHTVGELLVGGAFFSIQEWHGMAPNVSLTQNWEGLPFSKEQWKLLRHKPAIWKPSRGPSDGLQG